MAYLCGGNTHHRERGRKPLPQARFNAKRGENQGFLPTIDVESDPRFAPQLYPLTHGSTFPVRLLREPRVRHCEGRQNTPYQILLAWRGGSGGGMDPERGMLGQCSSSAGPYPLHAPPWVIWYSAVGRARENRLPGCIPAHHW